jgi:hypothetical protein
LYLRSHFTSSFERGTNLIGIKGEVLYAIVGPRIECCNLQGTVKNTLVFTDAEGPPATLDINGNFLVVATENGFIKMWDLSRREPRQFGGGPKQFTAGRKIESVRCNSDGMRVSVLCTKSQGSSWIPDSQLHVWFSDLDKIEVFDFGARLQDTARIALYTTCTPQRVSGHSAETSRAVRFNLAVWVHAAQASKVTALLGVRCAISGTLWSRGCWAARPSLSAKRARRVKLR